MAARCFVTMTMTSNSLRVLLSGLVLFAISCIGNAQREGYCLASDYEPYLRFGTKSPYEFVKGKESNQHIVPFCKPVLFWSYNRHGTRLPGVRGMESLPKLLNVRDEIISNYEIRKTAPDLERLCKQDLDNLKAWTWNRNFTRNFAEDLTYQGYDDIKYMAKRWQTKFPELLSSQYSMRNYQFSYTDSRRTKDSYRAFLDGLFGRDSFDSVRPKLASANDTMLQLSEFCTAWITEVKNNPATKEQMNLFTMKEEYRTLVQNVSSHLGYRYNLDDKVISDIYDMCRYDKSWEINKNSPWCAAFTKDQLHLLEYVEDLKYYYKGGYGNKLNKKLGCFIIKDLLEKMKMMIEHPDQEQPKAVVYFTHSQMMQAIITALGIGEDSVPLTSDNYHTPNIMRRQYRTSLLNPFAANIAAVLYKCEQEGPKIMFFHNEQPVDFKGCRVGLCSWDWVMERFSKDAEECNINFCNKNAGEAVKVSYAIHILAAVMITIMGSITGYNT